MDFIKKQTIAFYIRLVSAILIIVGLILYLAGAAKAQLDMTSFDVNGSIVAMIIIALIAEIALLILVQLFKDKFIMKIVLTVLMVVVPVMLVAAFITSIGDSLENMAFIFGSEFDVPEAKTKLIQIIVAAVILLIACLANVATGFMKETKRID